MSEKNIDALLDQVAMAMAEGDNETASHLLPEILQSGDEVQRLMAESYLMQLDALLAMEQEEALPIPQHIVIDEADEIPPELIAMGGNDGDEDNNEAEPTAEVTISIDNDSSTEALSLQNGVDDLVASTTRNIDSTSDVATSTVEEQNNIVEAVNNPVENPTDTIDIVNEQEATTEISELSPSHDADIINREPLVTEVIDELPVNQVSAREIEPSLPTEEVDEEIKMALTQATLLIDDGEYETAELILQAVLDSDNEALHNQAELMMLQIKEVSSSVAVATPEIEEATNVILDEVQDISKDTINEAPHSSVIDNIFDEEYGGFSTYKDDLEASLAEDNVNTIIEQSLEPNDTFVESSSTEHFVDNTIEQIYDDNSAPVFISESDNLQQTIEDELHTAFALNEEAIVTSDEVVTTVEEVIPPEFIVDKNSDSDDIEKQTFIETVLEETEDTVVHEIFSDHENIDGLLPPTQVLQSLSGESADEILGDLPQHIETGIGNQRQGFYVGDLGLMIDFADGSELTEMPEYFKIPNAPAWFIGLTNMHGVVIPVFDLKQYFNISSDSKAKQRKPMLLVLQHDEKSLGIIVNGLPTRLTWHDGQKVDTNTSPVSIRDHVDVACLIEENLWFDLNTEMLTETLENSI